MVNPTFSIGGLASGLDTTAIIDQLLQIERQPIVRYQRQQQELRTRDEAWGSVVSRLSGLRSSLDEVRRAGALASSTTASSSDEEAVQVTSTGGGEPSELSFVVDRLATRHRVGLGGSFGSVTDFVGTGTLTLTDETGGTVGTITTDGTTTLKDLADQIDALGVGVDAQVLKVGEGDFQLVLQSTTTGGASQFSATTDLASLGTVSQLQEGLDARLYVGGLAITRASNTITDLIDGAEVTLRETTAAEVTVGVARDEDAIVESVKEMVDAFNAVLDRLGTLTKYDPETGRSGALQGDPIARDMAFNLRAELTKVVSQEGLRYVGDVGMSLSRDGRVELDESALRDALAEDADAVFGLFSQTLSGDSGVGLGFVGDDAVAGDISMTVTQAATVASATGATSVWPSGTAKTFSITSADGTVATITIDAGMSAAQAVQRINSALDAAEMTNLRASVEDDGAGGETLRLSTLGYGSSQSFSVAGYGADLDGTHTGTDVVADFGSGPVTGSGRSVSGTDAANDLTLNVTGGVGTYALAFSTGIGGVLDSYLSALEGTDGLIESARSSIESSIDDFDDQIAAFESRLELREVSLRRKFGSLESTLGNLQQQGNWLAGQLASLPSAG